jgi:hypothetical protein
MSMDLVISDKGAVMIASNEPFPGEVMRVDFHSRRKLLMINYEKRETEQDVPEGELLNLEIHDRMMSALLKAPSVMLVHFLHNAPGSGYEVPLVQLEFTPAQT